MADNEINVNALPVKTAPSTGDKMLMIGSAEEYQIDYDQLASAILDKLATKQYSELDTTAKTVLGALDELNGKSGAVTDENTLNAVEKLKSEVWSTYDTGTILETFTAGGPLFCVIGYKNTDDYGAVILFSYYSNRASFVRVASGSWSTPVYV